MAPIEFGVTKTKVAVTLNYKMVSADYIENHVSQSFHISHLDWS